MFCQSRDCLVCGKEQRAVKVSSKINDKLWKMYKLDDRDRSFQKNRALKYLSFLDTLGVRWKVLNKGLEKSVAEIFRKNTVEGHSIVRCSLAWTHLTTQPSLQNDTVPFGHSGMYTMGDWRCQRKLESLVLGFVSRVVGMRRVKKNKHGDKNSARSLGKTICLAANGKTQLSCQNTP